MSKLFLNKINMNRKTLALLAIVVPLLLAFVYVVVRSGPLAPVPVTVSEVSSQAISPALFGIGIVEAKYSYRIGPIQTGHVLSLLPQVGDRVIAGQVLGEMDPVDMANKITSREAAIKGYKAAVNAAEARVADALAREQYAKTQSQRYAELVKSGTVSAEISEAKYQEYQISTASLQAARANLIASGEELAMQRADHAGLLQQLNNLSLVSPVDGLVVGRYVEPGSTVVAGQTVLEVIDPASVWINVRFDQLHANGLVTDLPVSIVLRSQAGKSFKGRVARLEPLADAVTEEFLAKVVFDQLPEVLPPVGELAEVTVSLAQLASTLVVPNASIKYLNGQTGVWVINNKGLDFVQVELGVADLDGRVQVLSGLKAGDQIAVYSKQVLTAHSRVQIVDSLVVATK